MRDGDDVDLRRLNKVDDGVRDSRQNHPTRAVEIPVAQFGELRQHFKRGVQFSLKQFR